MSRTTLQELLGSKFPAPPPSTVLTSLAVAQTLGAPSKVQCRWPHLSCGMDPQEDDLPSSIGIVP